MEFHKTLSIWYLSNKRDLPWRRTADPYHIWLSEIMLQQTRIDQGLPYYLKFIAAFPTVFDLAKAPQDEVLKLWQGLGYYSRARNLHETAQFVANSLDGKFPESYSGLIKLKGIGEYTASAISSMCYREPVAVVDGNVYRLLARYFDIETPVNSSAGIREFKELARELLDTDDPGTYNQAVMEFGALQCKPKLPLCKTCPLSDSCLALKLGKVGNLPLKLKKAKIRNRYFNYLVFLSEENKTIFERRSGKGIWEGLYQFPLIETKAPVAEADIIGDKEFVRLAGKNRKCISLYNESPVVHKLSHQHIHTRFWIIQSKELPQEAVPVAELDDYPVPVLIANFLNEYGFSGY